MTPPEDALLACPFCGTTPVVSESGRDGRGTMIECLGLDCVNPHVSYYGNGKAAAVWNRRAPDPLLALADELARAARAARGVFKERNGVTRERWERVERQIDDALAAYTTARNR